MLIILEGCDGAGKTALAENLSRIIKADIIHHSKPMSMKDITTIYRKSKTKSIIADRFHLGQYVYNKPEERLLDERAMLEIKYEFLKHHDVKFIYVTADKNDISERLSKRKEKCNITEILNKYEEVLDKYIDSYILWNTSTGVAKEVSR